MMGVTAIFAAGLMATIVIPPGGLWGPVPGAGTAAPGPPPALPLETGPRSTAEMATVNPSGTLSTDEFDLAVAASAAEVAKSRGGEVHVHPAPQTSTPAPAVHQHSEPAPAPPKKAVEKKPAAKKPV